MIFPSCFLLILYGLVHKSFGFWFNAPGVLNNKIVHYPRHCIDTTVSPVNDQNEHVAKISKLENSTPTMKDKFTVRPELITFDAYDTLIAPCQSIGRWYREALNTACDMSIRLPRPQLFQISFETVYNEMCSNYPCFGQSSGMTAEAWWRRVVEQTYLRTKHNTQLEPDEVAQVMPVAFDLLYKDIFGTGRGWVVKENVEYTLSRLKQWRDVGGGPLIGVVSNCDERLHTVLRELGLSSYLDLVITAESSGTRKPDPAIFQLAAQRAGQLRGGSAGAGTGASMDPALCFHVGSSVAQDMVGAAAAGWTALRYHEWFDEDFPGWDAAEGEDLGQEQREQGQRDRRAALQWGRRSTDRNVTLPDGSTVPLEWYELWSLEDVLTLFGFPHDTKKTYKTTVLKGAFDED